MLVAPRPHRHDHPPPNFQLLQQGLTLASDPLPHAGMRRAVVLISSLLPALNEVPISDAVSRAGEMHTPIHALLVGPEQSVDQPGAATLQRLAGGSGGLYAYFDSPQAGQPLLELVSSYRLQYLLGYRSTLSTSGRHRLAAAVRTGDLNLTTPPLEFALSVEPAAVAFISPPTALTRRSNDPTLAAAALPPTEQALRVIIEFPDGHPRAIVRSQLLVDGQPLSEHTGAPFDQFVWDLSGYDATAVHRLRAVVTDELGLQGSSIDVPVQVTVRVEHSPVRRLEPFLRPLAILGGIVLAGALLAVLVTVSLRRPRPRQQVNRQPAETPRPPPRARPRRGRAFLETLPGEAETPDARLRRIELAEPVTYLGRDPSQVEIVFEDRSVSRRHARIEHYGRDQFVLFDEASTSGTWVNLEPVAQAGALLRHGDRINLGRVALVFNLRSAHAAQGQPTAPVSTHDTGPLPAADDDTRRILPRGRR